MRSFAQGGGCHGRSLDPKHHRRRPKHLSKHSGVKGTSVYGWLCSRVPTEEGSGNDVWVEETGNVDEEEESAAEVEEESAAEMEEDPPEGEEHAWNTP